MKTIKAQILLAKEKTLKLITDIPVEKWFVTPNVIESNLNWQIGHIILANYLHGIASISGASEEFKNKVNVADYIKFYGPKSNPNNFKSEKPSSEELLEIYDLTFVLILKGIKNLRAKDLQKETAVPNPAVKIKYDALLWLSQHQSWHNGQIAMLKRVLTTYQ
ncbi:DinB family protein [Tenacibaculum ovolyticum]|uniref:DinB family protein n=1 Tax=Tenacibaculum ovolyticum TaxID=104270 RepID=UPI003BAB2D1C